MSRSDRPDWEGKSQVAKDGGDDAALRELDEVAEAVDEEEPRFFADPKRLAQTLAIVVVLVVGIYLGAPKVLDLENAFGELGDADPVWVGVALVFCLLSFVSYVALFRGVVGENVLHLEWAESYQITMAGLAATRLFSAGGAGGIILTYWALRKAGMPRKQSACRMVAFLVLLYTVYMLALIIDGILLRTGVVHGEAPVGLTIVPAGIAALIIIVFLGIALIPPDLERRLVARSESGEPSRFMRWLAAAPATLGSGTRTAIDFVRNPRRGGEALFGAIGFWAANVGILWASFHAFDVSVPLAVVTQGFFIGMFANLIPLPGGVGGVDAGMIGAFALFGLPGTPVFAAVLTYRVIAFWLPIPPGVVAFFQLRKTVARWEAEGRPEVESGNGKPAEASITSKSKVDYV
jgi:uncharacterized membrane protein YbhN (UPF0104 family)